jgi:hypothetical protein
MIGYLKLDPHDTHHIHLARKRIEPVDDPHRSIIFHELGAIIRRQNLRVGLLPRISH